jgi:hypothetical protein
MTRDALKKLQVGDRVTHPAFIGFLTVTHIETSFDYSVSPSKQYTDAITVGTEHRLKITDERDVRLLKKIN